jgi:hypothetical protein
LSPARTVRAPAKSKSKASPARTVRARAKSKSKASPARTAARGEEMHNGIGSAAVAAKTGKGWPDWFAILDRAKANTWPHKQIASFLYDEHSVPGWWCQMITVGYEQARGLRAKHQKASGFAASASKTIEAPVEKLFDAWNEESLRRSWLGSEALTIRKSTRPKSMRITWADGTSVAVSFSRKGTAKSQVAIDHEKLKAAGDVARMKKMWGAALDKLKAKLERN